MTDPSDVPIGHGHAPRPDRAGFLVRWRTRPNTLLPFWLLCIASIHLSSGIIDLLTSDAESAFRQTMGSLALIGLVGGLGWCFRKRLRISHNAYDYIAIFLAMIALDAGMSLALPNQLGLEVVDQVLRSTALLSTTAAQTVAGLDTAPRGFIWHAACLQGVGAVWFVQFTTVAIPSQVFVSLGEGDSLDLSSSANMSASLSRVWLSIVGVFVALVSLASCGFWLLGTTWFEGFVLSAALVSLGGQTGNDASLGYFNDPQISWFAIVVMLAGATNWLLHLKFAVSRQVRIYASSRELQVFLILVFVVTLFVKLNLVLLGDWSWSLETATHAAVYTVSTITTTGVATADYEQFSGLLGFTLLLIVIGGCTGSPSGGIKIARLIYQFRVFGLILSGRRFTQIGQHTVSLSSLQFMQIFMTIFLALILVSTAVLSFFGLDLLSALSMTISNLTNLGVGLGDIVGPSRDYGSMPDIMKYWAAMLMILGRFELGLVFVFLSARYWLSPETLAEDR